MGSYILLISASGLTPEPPKTAIVGRVFLLVRVFTLTYFIFKRATYLMTLANVTKDDAGFPPALCTHQL